MTTIPRTVNSRAETIADLRRGPVLIVGMNPVGIACLSAIRQSFGGVPAIHVAEVDAPSFECRSLIRIIERYGAASYIRGLACTSPGTHSRVIDDLACELPARVAVVCHRANWSDGAASFGADAFGRARPVIDVARHVIGPHHLAQLIRVNETLEGERMAEVAAVQPLEELIAAVERVRRSPGVSFHRDYFSARKGHVERPTI